MVETFFLICAVLGGSILVLQAVLALLGFGLGEGTDVGDLADVGDIPDGDLSAATPHHHGQWNIGKILSIQAVLAFLTFFGIGGMSALEGGATRGVATAVAFTTGVIAMFVLGWFLGLLRKLQSDGTVRLSHATGQPGRVYLTIPGNGGGVGKVTVVLQGRSIEVEARTPGPELRGGEEVVISRVLDDRTVEVVCPASHVVKPVALND